MAYMYRGYPEPYQVISEKRVSSCIKHFINGDEVYLICISQNYIYDGLLIWSLDTGKNYDTGSADWEEEYRKDLLIKKLAGI